MPAMSGIAIGVDLGGTNLRIAAVDEDGNLLDKVTTSTRVGVGPEPVIEEMCAAIRKLKAKHVTTSQPLLGIGIGIPGIIDMHTGTLRESPNLPGWHEYPVRQTIEQRLESPVVLENDANAAAFGEAWLGAGREVENLLMVTLGTGVGGGIVLGGKIWHGMNGMAGEVGHITVDADGPRCPCGNTGCVEQYASATAIMRMAGEKISANSASGLARASLSRDVEFNAECVFNLALQGDGPSREIFQVVGWALGILLSDVINALNLQMYVIGGGVSAAWDLFEPAMLKELRKRSIVYTATAPDGNRSTASGSSRHTLVTRALLGSDAGLVGAARLPMVEAERRHHSSSRTK